MTLPSTRVQGPPRAADRAGGPPAEERSRRGAGTALLQDVSVVRTASVLTGLLESPEEPVRLLLAGLEAFASVQPGRALPQVLSRAWSEPASADAALASFAGGLPGDDDQVARLGFGPKLWFTTNGVPVAWRPLAPARPVPPGVRLDEGGRVRAAAQALRGCGLTPGAVRLGDLGRLAPGAVFVPDLLAEPLAVRVASSSRAGLRLVFLPDRARLALLSVVLMHYAPDAACRHAGAPALGPDLASRLDQP